MVDSNSGMEGKTKIEAGSGNFSTAMANELDNFASFTQIFTWSSLTREDLYTLNYRKNNYKPSNVIAKTGGIAGMVNPTRQANNATTGDASIAESEAQLNRDFAAGFLTSRQILELGRDLFFERVVINTVPAANDSRPMTAVTSIEMEVHEPLGLSLISKMRGAAYNCGFQNHVTAPYLLTIEYEGWDNDGKAYKLDRKYSRQIPIKVVEMEVNVNQGGAIYQIRAVPFNEFGFVDRFNKITSDVKINSGKTLADFCKALTQALNETTDTEVNQRYYSETGADQFLITCDPKFANNEFNTGNAKLTNVPLSDVTKPNQPDTTQKTDDKKLYETAKKQYQALGQLVKGTGITAVLKDAMKLIPPFDSYENLMKDFQAKADGSLAETVDKWIANKGDYQLSQHPDRLAFLRKNEDAFFIDTFRIVSGIKILEQFDYKTKDHKKIIHYHIEPYKIHVLNFAQPGLSSKFDQIKNLAAQANRFAARKIYNYIFTGENNDILNLDLRYNVAYFSPMYKSPDPVQYNKTDTPRGVDTGRDANLNNLVEPELPNWQYRTAGGKQANSGILGINPAFDLWMDGFNNPIGDMVNVEMEIRGDPIYISSNQFNPLATPDTFPKEGVGVWTNTNRSSKNGSSETFDEDSSSYNTNSAEPYVVLNYRFPVDINLETGEYELNQGHRSPFNGLYRVYGVQHMFDRGQFRQKLQMNRFKDQGYKVDAPTSNQYTEGFKGNTPTQLKDFKTEFKDYFNFAERLGAIIDSGIKALGDKIKNLLR